MNTSAENYVTANEILADVLKFVDDEKYRVNSPGFYISQIQQALQELSFDTFFDERTKSFDMPENRILPMPEGAFNLRQVYLFNGTVCDINTAQNVYWARNYFHRGGSGVKRDKGNRNERDPFYGPRSRHRDKHITDSLKASGDYDPDHPRNLVGGRISDVHYFEVQNGMIMFSEKCANFEKILLVYNGTGGNIGDAPIIPMFLREAVKDFVTEVVLRIRMAKDQELGRWQALWNVTNQKLNGRRRPEDGSWYKAEIRVKMMDSKAREDLKEYLSRLDY